MMKRILALITVLFPLTWNALDGAPLKPVPPRYRELLEPFGQKNYVETFAGQQRACVIVLGGGSSPLGLYIYDIHGNCISWDDQGNNATGDSAAVEWIPPKEGTYTIQVRSLGNNYNQFKIAIR